VDYCFLPRYVQYLVFFLVFLFPLVDYFAVVIGAFTASMCLCVSIRIRFYFFVSTSWFSLHIHISGVFRHRRRLGPGLHHFLATQVQEEEMALRFPPSYGLYLSIGFFHRCEWEGGVFPSIWHILQVVCI
jgi:hypothetical protein